MRMTKVLAFFMTIVMVFCCIPIIPVAEAASIFKDMPQEGHWPAALKTAVNTTCLTDLRKPMEHIKPDAFDPGPDGCHCEQGLRGPEKGALNRCEGCGCRCLVC